MSKETFKIFASKHPELANQVISDNITWQKLFELYEIYGENSSVWNDFLINKTQQSSIKGLFNTFRNLDMNAVQKGITNIQKTITLIQDLGISSSQNQMLDYEPRPIYRRFED